MGDFFGGDGGGSGSGRASSSAGAAAPPGSLPPAETPDFLCRSDCCFSYAPRVPSGERGEGGWYGAAAERSGDWPSILDAGSDGRHVMRSPVYVFS
jgi:hypothetical protein